MEWLTVQELSTVTSGNEILHTVSFTLPRCRRLAIAGETGSGKSTLLKAIGGLVQPSSGAVYFEGEKVPGPLDKLIPGHPRIGYLSQQYELRNHYRVEEELAYTNTIGDAEAQRIYEICEVNHLLHRYTHQLSGGEKQRIATARVLIAQPQLLLLDEPFSNLDPLHKKIMQRVVEDISSSLNITVILVDHEPKDTLSWADEILVLKDGELLQKGSPQTLYYTPLDAYVAGLFGEFNILRGEWAQRWFGRNGPILLRPEHLEIGAPNEKDPQGILLRSRFFGSFTWVEVQVGQEKFTALPGNGLAREGDKVSLRLRKN